MAQTKLGKQIVRLIHKTEKWLESGQKLHQELKEFKETISDIVKKEKE